MSESVDPGFMFASSEVTLSFFNPMSRCHCSFDTRIGTVPMAATHSVQMTLLISDPTEGPLRYNVKSPDIYDHPEYSKSDP